MKYTPTHRLQLSILRPGWFKGSDISVPRFKKEKKKKIKSPSLRIFPCSYLPYSSIHFLKGKCSYCLPPSIWHWPRKLRALATPQDVFHLNIIFRSWGDKICLFDNREEEIISLGKNLFCLKISIGGELNVKMSYFFNGTNGYFYQRLFFESLSPVSFFFILRKKSRINSYMIWEKGETPTKKPRRVLTSWVIKISF